MAQDQVSTKRPTITKPKLLRSMALIRSLSGSAKPRSSCKTLTSSIVLMSKATATDKPVIVRL